jgi:hypothetical protein
MGRGAFIAPLREKGVCKERIVGIDIEPLSGMQDEGATTIRGIDFFTWCASTERRFTKIVANPPYVAICKLHPQLQKPLLSYGPGTDRSFALSSNYWCAFLSASLRVLEQNGNLAFVLPAAWEYALYAADVRQAIYRDFQSVEAVESLLRSRSAQRFVRLIHCRQQCDVSLIVTGGEPLAAALPGSHHPAFGVLADQPRHLRPAQARYLPDVPFHQTFAAPVQTDIALRAQRPLRPLIEFFSMGSFEYYFVVAG